MYSQMGINSWVNSLYVREHQGMLMGHVQDLYGGGGGARTCFHMLGDICFVERHRCFLLNNNIFTFHDLFTFTESIDKQQPLVNLL